MKAILEKLENNRAVLSVEVEAPVVEEALQRAYQRVVRRVNIPGFRKGRAPRRVVERYVGKDALWDEALEHLIGHAYDHAVAAVGIEPVDRPRIEIINAEEGEPLTFKAVVVVKPEVDLGDYRSVSVPLEVMEVTEADVEEQLRRMRERHAELIPLENGEAGPNTVVGFTVKMDDQESAGEMQWAEIGSGHLREEFEKQILGARPGEARSVEIAFPADHPDEKLAGRRAAMTVTIHEIKEKRLPELTESFIQEVAKCSSLEELRSRIENRLREAAQVVAERLQVTRAVEAVVGRAQVDIPDVLIDRRLETLMNRWMEDLVKQGLSLEAYMRRTGRQLEDITRDLRSQAEKEVRTELVLEAVARKENITVSDEDVARRLEEVRLPETMAGVVRYMLLHEKAAAFIKDIAAANAAAKDGGEAQTGSEKGE